jgi:hypothetical protein
MSGLRICFRRSQRIVAEKVTKDLPWEQVTLREPVARIEGEIGMLLNAERKLNNWKM